MRALLLVFGVVNSTHLTLVCDNGENGIEVIDENGGNEGEDGRRQK